MGDLCNRYGADGWELARMQTLSPLQDFWGRLYLKRPNAEG
jgi:hypothetical protein